MQILPRVTELKAFLACAAALTVCNLLPVQAVGTQSDALLTTGAQVDFRTFTGMCQGWSVFDLADYIGWDREDFSWDKIEPHEGQWNEAELEKWGKRILALKERGINMLPILCYGTPWAIDLTPRVALQTDSSRVELKQDGNGFFRETYKKAHNGNWVRESATRVSPNNRWALSADKVQAWENYVRRIVSYYSAPPYNLEYFQIWNEAHPASGFWQFGSMDEYMTRIHLPAAKIIHELGGKVVYGGWPDCGPIRQYIEMLDRHDAWRTIDVHDVHYAKLSVFETIDKAARERGLGTVPIWQTEIGYVWNTGTIPNLWPRFMAWALDKGWEQPDRYKLFWFPAYTPDDKGSYGYGRSLLHGRGNLSAHGEAMRTIGSVFSPGQLGLYSGQVQSRPRLSAQLSHEEPSMEVFTVGDKRIVAAVHLRRDRADPEFLSWDGPRETIDSVRAPVVTLSFDEALRGRVSKVRRVGMSGSEMKLAVGGGVSGGPVVSVPIVLKEDLAVHPLFENATIQTVYVVVDLI